jgi:recombination protein RecA
LSEALKTIEKHFGKWAIMRMGENANVGMVSTFHSWSYVLDLILGGWYPEWRVVEIYGPESSGKTTIALHAIAEIQKRWQVAAFIDAEHALRSSLCENFGSRYRKFISFSTWSWRTSVTNSWRIGKIWSC